MRFLTRREMEILKEVGWFLLEMVEQIGPPHCPLDSVERLNLAIRLAKEVGKIPDDVSFEEAAEIGDFVNEYPGTVALQSLLDIAAEDAEITILEIPLPSETQPGTFLPKIPDPPKDPTLN